MDVVRENGAEMPIWLNPRKMLLRVGAYIADPEFWVKRFDDAGQLASLKRGNKAVAISFTPQEFDAQRELLKDFFSAALNADLPAE